MKHTLTIALLLLCLNCSAQKLFGKYNDISYGSSFLSGVSTGIREQVLYHPTQLLQIIGCSHRQWWDIRVSYKNKDKMSPCLVAVSDANHFFKSATLVTNCVAVGFSISDLPKKHKAIFIAEKILLSYVANKIGFFATYNVLFKNNLQ